MDENRIWTIVIMGKAIEVLIKLLGNDKLWELIGKIVDLLQKRGVVESGDNVKVTVYPNKVTNKIDVNENNVK